MHRAAGSPHRHRKRVCSVPQAACTTPRWDRSLISVGVALSRKVRVPSCPLRLDPQPSTRFSVTMIVWQAPAAIHRTPYHQSRTGTP